MRVSGFGFRVWDARSHEVVGSLETASPCTSVEVSRDGRYITTADGNEVVIWDADRWAMWKGSRGGWGLGF